MADQAFEREPVMWTSTRPDYNRNDRERSYVREGRLVTERIPQTGSQGEYDNRTPITHVRRWLPIINHGGHEVPVVFTNAAADLNNTGPVAQYQWAMIRGLGWFWPGACPVALVSTGELRADLVVAKSILGDRPCEPGTYGERTPCKHTVAEKAARMTLTAADDARREAAYKSDTDRQIAAQRDMNSQLIAAQGEQQRALIEALLGRAAPPAATAGEDPQLAALREENRRLAEQLEAAAAKGDKAKAPKQ
jgi:hypothetical protein